jgi:hypothetical protein
MTGTWTASTVCSAGFRVWMRDWQLFAVNSQHGASDIDFFLGRPYGKEY